MSDYQKRITSTYLSYCSHEKAYEWLCDNTKKPTDSEFSTWERPGVDNDRRVLEYILLKRKHSVIDLGLAQHGVIPYILRKVFARGGCGVRCAVLSNFALIDSSLFDDLPVIDLANVIKSGNSSELEALGCNPYLPDGFYENLIERKEYFSKITDNNYQKLIYRFSENARLSKSYNESWTDGYSDYKYNRVFTAAWKLSLTVPATQQWASILCRLLQKTLPPIGLKNVDRIIERWQIDRPKGNCSHSTGISFLLRSILADLLDADDKLLNSPDLALRKSFYRRFNPYKYKDWPEFLTKDGEVFLEDAIRNFYLWKSRENREILSGLVHDCPDSNSSMMVYNSFQIQEGQYREKHPSWFYEEDDEYRAPNQMQLREE